MNADKQIKGAIAAAVAKSGQDTSLAEKILAWFDAVADDSGSVNDREAMQKHIAILLEATAVTVEEVDVREDGDDGN